jgi:hypothetical protein
LTVIAIDGHDKAANGPRIRDPPPTAHTTVLLDKPMAAWQAYRIPGQPAAVLLDRAGRERGRWLGPFDNAEVLAATRGL